MVYTKIIQLLKKLKFNMKPNNNNIPPELQAIKPPSSVQECIDIATSIPHFESAVDKYKIFQAQEFFISHIFDFNKEQFSTIIKNKLFARKYIQQTAYDILKKCADDEIVYPVVLNSWFDKHVSYTLQGKYVALLDRENNDEQLRAFNDKLPHLVMEQFDKSDDPSYSLIKIVTAKLPEKIFKIKAWDDTQVAEWIKNNPEKSKDILHQNLHKFNNGTLQFPKSKKQLYKNIIEEHLNDSNEVSDRDNAKFKLEYSYTNYPIDYLEYLTENYSDLFNEYLNKKVIHREKDKAIVNGLQSIVFDRDDSYYNLIKEFSKYKDLLQQDVKIEIGFYTKQTNFFEYCLKEELYQPFIFFNLNDNLKDDEKEILVAAAFMYFKNKHVELGYKAKKNEILNHWYPEIMQQCSDKQFNRYAKKLGSSVVNNRELSQELEVIELSRELNNPNNPTTTGKKLKL
jgi:hypothetical protein